jgi:glycerol kinase
VGVWNGTDDLAANWAAHARWTPSMPADRRETLYKSWKKAVGRSFEWAV